MMKYVQGIPVIQVVNVINTVDTLVLLHVIMILNVFGTLWRQAASTRKPIFLESQSMIALEISKIVYISTKFCRGVDVHDHTELIHP